MKYTKLTISFCLLLTSLLIGVTQTHAQTKISQTKFTINRECDGGACHFEIISFNYGRNSSLSVGIGDASLSYYFSVAITNGKNTREYIYHDQPNIHFIEKDENLLNTRDCYCTHLKTDEKIVDDEFSKILLDVYKLGNYISENDINTRNKTYSETGRFAVLTNLRNYASSSAVSTTKSNTSRKVLAEKSWQTFWVKFSNAIYKKDLKTLTQLSSSDEDFFDGGGGGTSKDWFKMMSSEWNLVKKAVMSGIGTIETNEGQITRSTNKHIPMIFTFEKDNKWRFSGVMGD